MNGVGDMRKIAIASPDLGDDEWHALREPLSTGWLTQGPKVAAFEKAFAHRHNVKHAIAVTSATTGLHLALSAAGIGPGDEVIVPAFTWVSTANCVLYCGATPVFVDVDRVTFNIDVADLKRRLSPRTRAIIPVHLFGLCADIEAIRALVNSDILMLEDAACAAGAAFNSRPAGSLGEIGVFSFHPRKSITTGEGGMITTNSDQLAERARTQRNHGASVSEEERHLGPRQYLLPDFAELGFNYRMTDLQGAVGLVQLAKLDRYVTERSEGAAYYRKELGSLPWLRLPAEPSNGRHAWQAFVTYVDPVTAPMPRNEIMEYLQQRGIATRPGTHAVHLLSYYRDRFKIEPGDYPAARDCDAYSMAIPLHNRMSSEDYQYVVDALMALKR
jgi:perosamine synthetase